jgi:Restriction endonuclease
MITLTSPLGFVFSFERRDSFGSLGASLPLFTLPRGTETGVLAATMALCVRHYRDGAGFPSPFRWGLIEGTPCTSVADALEPLGITPTMVCADYLQCRGECGGAGSRSIVFSQLEGQQWNTLVVQIGDFYTNLNAPTEGCFRFPPESSPQQVAAVIGFWMHLDARSLDVFNPYRYGSDHQDLVQDQAARALYKREIRVVRSDSDRLRVLTGGTLLPGMDCLTLRDTFGRILVLGKSCADSENPLVADWTVQTLRHGQNPEAAARRAGLSGQESLGDPRFQVPAGISPEDLAALVAEAFERSDVYRTQLSLTELQASHNLDSLRDTIAAEDAAIRGARTPGIPKPELRLIRTPQDAELGAAAWMRWLGYDDAEVTGPGADGGVDVTSRRCVAQVKTETLPIGRPALQRLLGVAVAEGKEGMFFSISGYTPGAIVWADAVSMPLFRFDLQGEPSGANAEGQQRLR